MQEVGTIDVSKSKLSFEYLLIFRDFQKIEWTLIEGMFEHYLEHKRGRCLTPFPKLQRFHGFWQIRAPYAPLNKTDTPKGVSVLFSERLGLEPVGWRAPAARYPAIRAARAAVRAPSEPQELCSVAAYDDAPPTSLLSMRSIVYCSYKWCCR